MNFFNMCRNKEDEEQEQEELLVSYKVHLKKIANQTTQQT